MKISPPGQNLCSLNADKRKSKLDKCPRCTEVTIYEKIVASNEKTNNIARYFGSYLFSYANDNLHNSIGMILERGTPLEAHVKGVAPLTCQLLKSYLRDVLSGLSFLIRTTSFATTDLKPHNLIVSPNTGHLQLIDFGLGKSNIKWNELSELYVSPTDDMGTVFYLPPEVHQINHVSLSKILSYQVGALLFELFTNLQKHCIINGNDWIIGDMCLGYCCIDTFPQNSFFR
ncbi:MAG: hypothetical protein GY853_15495 [PVC group bacterium]|nr:hypothetical protein [PVC group bacterium]